MQGRVTIGVLLLLASGITQSVVDSRFALAHLKLLGIHGGRFLRFGSHRSGLKLKLSGHRSYTHDMVDTLCLR